MARRRNKALERAIAADRIERLLELAHEAARAGRVDDARRYGALARRVAMRYTLRPSATLRTRVCRGCSGYLLPGATARTRLTGGAVSTTCLACGRVRRLPLTRERRARRAAPPAPVPLAGPR